MLTNRPADNLTVCVDCVDCGAGFASARPGDVICDGCWVPFELDLARATRGLVVNDSDVIVTPRRDAVGTAGECPGSQDTRR